MENFNLKIKIPKWAKVKLVLIYLVPGIFWFFAGILLITVVELSLTWIFDLLGKHNPFISAGSTEVYSYTKFLNLVVMGFIYFKFVASPSPSENDDNDRNDSDNSGSPSYSESVADGTDHIFY